MVTAGSGTVTHLLDDTAAGPAGRAAPGRRGRARRDRTRSRRLLLASVAGAVSVGLAGCGGGSTAPAEAPSGSASSAEGFPVTLTGKEGTATISAPPQRVLTLGFQRDAETALALGVTPVAMASSPIFPSGIPPWTESALHGSKPEMLDTANGLPYEKIAGLQPDLILGTDSYELADAYDRLSQIAPTVSYLEGADTDTWQQRTELVGTALGRGQQAKQLVTDTENKVRQAAADNPGFAGKTVSFSIVSGGQIYTVLGDDASATFLKQLGLRISPQVEAQPESDTPGRALISPENLGVLDADLMIVTAPTEQDRRFLESSPLFSQLGAVRNGTYIPMDFPISVAMGFPSPLSIPYALDGMVPAISKALG